MCWLVCVMLMLYSTVPYPKKYMCIVSVFLVYISKVDLNQVSEMTIVLVLNQAAGRHCILQKVVAVWGSGQNSD